MARPRSFRLPIAPHFYPGGSTLVTKSGLGLGGWDWVLTRQESMPVRQADPDPSHGSGLQQNVREAVKVTEQCADRMQMNRTASAVMLRLLDLMEDPGIPVLQELIGKLPTGTGTPCPLCTGRMRERERCAICGWEVRRRPTRWIRKHHLMTLVGTSQYGLMAVPGLRRCRVGAPLILSTFIRLSSNMLLQEALVRVLADAIRMPEPLPVMNNEQWTRFKNDDPIVFDRCESTTVIEWFKGLDQEAQKLFREARWENGHILCPHCKVVRATNWGFRHGSPIHRWRCLTLDQITQLNQERNKRRVPDTNITRSIPIQKQGGCGKHFSDTTDTIFASSKVSVSYWFILLHYGPRALEALQSAGLSPETLCRMSERLLLFVEREPTFFCRLQTAARLFLYFAIAELRIQEFPKQR